MRPPFPRNDRGKAPGRAPPGAPPAFRRRFSDQSPLSPTPRSRSTRSPFLLPPVGRSGSRPAGRPRTRDIGPFPDDLLPLQLLPFLPRQSEEAPEHLLVVVPHGLRGRRRHPQGVREGGTLRVVPCGDGDESLRAAVDPRRGKRHVPVSRPLPVPARDV